MYLLPSMSEVLPRPPAESPPTVATDAAARLRALLRYDILDTPKEADYDDIAAMASEICEAPIAVVNLVADDRQWFKAEVGIGVRSTPLETSFCAHAILRPGLTIIPDTRQDTRFDCNPLVTADGGIRFYAGALLETPEGLPIGTVCVLDTRPRDLTPFQARTLSRLARQVMTQLELRRALRDRSEEATRARDAEERLRLAQEAGGIGAFEVEIPSDRLTASPRFLSIFGLDPAAPAPETAATTRALILPADSPLASDPAGRAEGRADRVTEYRIRRADTGEERWIARQAEILRDAEGRPTRMRGVIQDVTDRKRAEERQLLLTRELLHRVKNNLAIIQAIATRTLRDAPSTAAAAETFGARLRALARALEVLGEGGVGATTVGEVVRGIVALHGDGGRRIAGEGPPVPLGASAALALSLALHELATNAAKYGALSAPEGHVAITWAQGGGALRFRWTESGGPPVTPPARRGFGSRLIEENLSRSWRGTAILAFAPAGVVLEASAPVAGLREG